jgi:hypothetical protein
MGQTERDRPHQALGGLVRNFRHPPYCIYKDRVDVGGIEYPIPGENEDEPFFDLDLRLEHRLVKAHILADKMRDVTSANLLMDRLFDHYLGTYTICDCPSLNSRLIIQPSGPQ